MDPVVLAAGTALVSAMATDAWQQARNAAVTVWRRASPQRAEAVGADLEVVRAQVLAARAREDEDTEQALAGSWRIQLQQLLDEDPGLADELQRLLDDHLVPATRHDERTDNPAVVQDARLRGSGRIIQVGRDAHISEPPGRP